MKAVPELGRYASAAEVPRTVRQAGGEIMMYLNVSERGHTGTGLIVLLHDDNSGLVQVGPTRRLFAGPFERKGGKYFAPPKF